MTHYRRLTPVEIATLRSQVAGMREYTALATLPGVRVGKSGGAVVVEVFGPDDERLPGKYLGDELADIPAATRKNVARARWERTSEDDPGEGTEGDIPPGATVLETGINPHHIAGRP